MGFADAKHFRIQGHLSGSAGNFIIFSAFNDRSRLIYLSGKNISTLARRIM